MLLPKILLLVFLVSGAQSLWPEDDPASYVGLTLTELIRRFGVPKSVSPSRGLEEWQDDVIFVYEQGNFYVFKDRVWQIGLRAAKNVVIGDTRSYISLVLGLRAVSRGNSVFYPLDEWPWPMMLRYDLDSAGKVEAIFIYRTDF